MRLTAFCLLLCLLAPVLQAQGFKLDEQEVKDWTGRLERVYLDPALKSGDLDAYAANLLKLIEESPTRASSVFALRRLMAMQSELADLRPLHELLGRLAKDDFKACTWRTQEYVDAWLRLERRFSTSLAWHAAAQRWGGITEAAYIGPFADGVAPA